MAKTLALGSLGRAVVDHTVALSGTTLRAKEAVGLASIL